ncbi:MAG TPA: dTDP-4-dehydrorhamnose reductase [Pseudonocardia sp.]|uniref:dTDP-4-dehydrorhamnose reductase n=1 Tax=Pseudonocardia sp. TaxID=60912 RepID=UPI002C348D50|nr:dTDP-4-dehydrorhamnose reductase [Pseudonocardia sp.]HTF48258.1 dTDP-4-dehydrorhamnose reductase [Pseudonocardia sp.]
MTGSTTAQVRWLITGARGQLGSDLVEVLRGEADSVTAAGRAELDLTGGGVADAVRRWAAGAEGRRLVVLNAAAWTDVDGAEADPAGAAEANATGPGRLAEACAEVGASLVHVSTDYVFPGDAAGARPYDVDDPIGPTTVYGKTKEAGERAVRAALGEHYVVRTAWLYGAAGNNFVKTIAALRHRRDTLDVVDDQRGCPTWSAELAGGLVELARSGAPHGTYHFAGGGETTWYGLARAVFEEVGADPDRIHQCDSSKFPRPAPRPAYSVLSGRSWAATGLRPPSEWRDALRSAFRVSRSSLDTPI